MVLRPYQTNAIQALRDNMANGIKSQILYAPTGAGKSVIAAQMVNAVFEKGKKALFLVDRRVLVKQFSKHLERMGIKHGVIMAKDPMHDPKQQIQVASCQTLEKHKHLGAYDLVFYDEAHTTRAIIKRIQDEMAKAKLIGLTATPLTKGLNKTYKAVVNVATMADLVKEKFLVPFKVFISQEIDTEGVKVVGGEFNQAELEERAVLIIGDVVSDYLEISKTVWGRQKKTIVFCSGVNHGKQLCEAFNAIGKSFVDINYRHDDEYKADVIAEFSKPDSSIDGLISCDILTRGFDVPDVEHVILARPLRKSLSTHIQMVGRGARISPGKNFCIAEGQMVLTHNGLVPIEKVSINDRLWDGKEYVTHSGIIFRGIKNVITYAGLTATADHRVKTKEGWRTFGECAKKQIPIVQTGFGRHPIWESENIFTENGMAWQEVEKKHVCTGAMHNVFKHLYFVIQQFKARSCERLQSMCKAGKSKNNHKQGRISSYICAKAEVYKPFKYALQRLRRKGYRVQVQDCIRRIFVGYAQFGIAKKFEIVPVGQDRQQWPLRAWKPAMGNTIDESFTYEEADVECKIAQVQDRQSIYSLCRCNFKALIQRWIIRFANNRKIPPSIEQAERKVWDILNSGERNSFTCQGLLVHNCVIQCNSGNYLRFLEDFEDIYENGIKELDDHKEKPKAEKTKKEKKGRTCPRCMALWPVNSQNCHSCGFIRPVTANIENVNGEITELRGKPYKREITSEQKQAFYWELMGYARRNGYKDGWAYHKYLERFGVAPAWKKQPMPPSAETVAYIKHLNIKYHNEKYKKARARDGVL